MLLGVRTIASCCVLALMVLVFGRVLVGNSLFYPQVAAEKSTAQNKWTIQGNIEDLQHLQEDKWERLSITEKLDILQIIANIESGHLGLLHELNVSVRTMEESVIAAYDDRICGIYVNVNHLQGSSYQWLEAICHESYHAFQHRLCDLYDSVDDRYKGLMLFENVNYLKKEFADYKSDVDNYYEYSNQYCEYSANQYAEQAASDYMDIIEDCFRTSKDQCFG